MAEKYCDHGLYGAASFTANTTSGSATLTVTAQASGTIALGTIVTGPGIPADTYISAYGTGRGVYSGSSVTYTMNRNATATATGIAVAGTYGNFSLDPVWGVAQEGDGTAKTAATPAAVDIDLSAATAAAGATISIMGAVLTCVASGAATNQFNAGSGATLVSNLVAAINRTTNTSAVAAQASGWATPKVQDTVFARVGSPTTTLQVMTRAGSAQYNSSTVATAGMTGGTFGPYTFSGGAGGAWSCLGNLNAATNASGVAVWAYGLLVGSAVNVLAGAISSGSTVRIRSAKSLKAIAGGFSPLLTMPLIGAASAPVVFRFDDGTQWADGANPVFNLRTAIGTSYVSGAATANPLSSSHVALVAPHDTVTGYYGLVIDNSLNTGSGSCSIAGLALAEGIHLKNSATAGGSVEVASTGSTGFPQFNAIKVTHNGDYAFISAGATSYASAATLRDIVCEQLTLATPSSGVINLSGAAAQECVIDGIRCVGFVTGSKLIRATHHAKLVTVREPEFGNVTIYGSSSWSQNSDASMLGALARVGCSISSSRGGRALLLDTAAGFAEWNPLRSYPTLSGQLVEGSPWSMRAVPSTQAGRCTPLIPFRLPPARKLNSLASGARTFTLQFAVKDTLSLTRKLVWFELDYVDTSGNVVRLSTYDAEGGALSSSSVTWSLESGGQVTYDDGGVMYFNKKHLTLETLAGHDLGTGSEIRVTPCLGFQATAMTDAVFFDYDVAIA